jgi:hypothetical protein
MTTRDWNAEFADAFSQLADAHEQRFVELGQAVDVANQLFETVEQEDSADEDMAQAARSGALGPDWQAVQRRVDRRETTLRAVFSGEDTSREAEALRELSQQNLRAARDGWQDQAEATPDAVEDNPLEELRAVTDELGAKIDELQDLIREAGL